MIEHKEQFWHFYNDDHEKLDAQKFQSAVKHLLDVVLRKDFEDYPDQEELRSKAKVKLMELLQGDDVDDSYDDIVPFLHKSIWQNLMNDIRDYRRDKEKHGVPLYVDDWHKVEEVYNEQDVDTNFPIKRVHDAILEFIPEETEDIKPMTDHLMGVKLYEYFFENQVMN